MSTVFFTIGGAERQPGVPKAQTIRLYEREGLIQPLRDSNGYRLFTEPLLEEIRRIHAERVARKGFGSRPRR